MLTSRRATQYPTWGYWPVQTRYRRRVFVMATETERPPLNAERLRSGLDFYAGVEVVEQTGSTNADLLARAGDADADRAVLIAEYQEHGRGRHSRTWVSPARAQIALSVLFRT